MTNLTMLSDMAGSDFASGLVNMRKYGMSMLDLKGGIFGKALLNLTKAEAKDAYQLILDAEMSVYCFSTVLFNMEIEAGENTFRDTQLAGVKRSIELADIMQPQVIRLLSAETRLRSELSNSATYIKDKSPWVISVYQEAIDMISAAGFHTTIENEVGDCIFTQPDEITDFFAMLNRPQSVHFTWDVQNLWGCGIVPTLEVYEQLKPIIGYYHVKGGQSGDDGDSLCWSSSLADASWPVTEITRQVIKDGISPVIFLNPSHGKAKPGYDYSNLYWRDIEFLSGIIREN